MDQLNVTAPPYFDPAALREELKAYWRESSDPAKARAKVVRRLKELKAVARSEAEQLLERTRRRTRLREGACSVSGRAY